MSRVIRVPGITYGNMEGQYFTQWRIELLEELLELIVYCYGDAPLVAVENICIWYDAAAAEKIRDDLRARMRMRPDGTFIN